MTYKFKTGDKGKTRGGYDYEVLHDNLCRLGGYFSAVIVTDNNGDQFVLNAAANGRVAGGVDSEYDLLPPTRKVYVNFYWDGCAFWYDNAVDAGRYRSGSLAITTAAVEVEIPCE